MTSSLIYCRVAGVRENAIVTDSKNKADCLVHITSNGVEITASNGSAADKSAIPMYSSAVFYEREMTTENAFTIMDLTGDTFPSLMGDHTFVKPYSAFQSVQAELAQIHSAFNPEDGGASVGVA
ncbi:unnamed protein product [Dibothriocephalus latus]|uniref:Uncharacterized protein n=1 Tax=Dibothriocephalus latus TaxID=60516 RepID=A0A3P7L1R3_DIBLA|nr:unnamed protein product [Dibothriocephalus latus]